MQSAMWLVFMILSNLLLFNLQASAATTKGFKPLHRISPFRASSNRHGELTAISVTSHLMEGEFRRGRLGIRFRSESTDTAQSITITSSSTGRNIFSSSLQSGNRLTVSILGGHYLVSSGPKLSGNKMDMSRGYHGMAAIPGKWRKAEKQRGFRRTPMQQYVLRSGYLQRQEEEKRIQNDIHTLLQSEEAKLIQQAAFEMGRRGHYGRDSTATMAFYILAMRLAQMQSPSPQPFDLTTHCLHEDDGEDRNESTLTEKEKLLASKGLTLCQQTGHYCELERCPWGEGCVGMCGVGCECWRMVCGDCCHHHGCLGFSHDPSCSSSCSLDSSTPSLSCFKVFGFTCDSPFTCS